MIDVRIHISYPWKQDEVVMIHCSSISVPSQTCCPFLYSATCQGQSPCKDEDISSNLLWKKYISILKFRINKWNCDNIFSYIQTTVMQIHIYYIWFLYEYTRSKLISARIRIHQDSFHIRVNSIQKGFVCIKDE